MEWVIGALVAAAAGLAQGCTGFGLALIAAPSLMFILPPTLVVPTVVVLSTLNTFIVAWDARRHVRFRMVGPLALGGFIGIPLGITALLHLPDALIKVFVGLFVTAFSLAMLRGWKKPLRHGDRPKVLIPVGIMSGFFGGSTSMGGPPVVLFLANQDTQKNIFRANVVTYFLTINIYSIALFTAIGQITWSLAGQLAVLIPAMLLGTYIGIRYAHRIPEQRFQRIAMGIVLAMGLLLFFTNIMPFIALFQS